MQRILNSRNYFTQALTPDPYIGFFSSLLVILLLWVGSSTHLRAQTVATAAPAEQLVIQKSFSLKSSQTLDKVVQEVYKDSPLSYPILRNALLHANPLVLSGNPAQKIKAGLTLVIPDHTQLVLKTLSPYISEQEVADKQNRTYGADPSTRRNWVRFP